MQPRNIFLEHFSERQDFILLKGSLELPHIFLIQQLAGHFLEKQSHVIFCAVHFSVDNYKYAMKKQFVTTNQCHQSGQLSFVFPSPCTSLDDLYSKVETAVLKSPTSDSSGEYLPRRHVALIIDSLSDLVIFDGLSDAESSMAISRFLRRCRALGSRIQTPFSLVAGAFSDIAVDSASWLLRAEHQCTVSVDLIAHPGGVAGVDGEVSITHRRLGLQPKIFKLKVKKGDYQPGKYRDRDEGDKEAMVEGGDDSNRDTAISSLALRRLVGIENLILLSGELSLTWLKQLSVEQLMA
mmetsp:Transcript_22797/g.40333  ORF Transcript_22797/g.40333 Transcript_22797/m.40333 type:complete len:295 (-) Transcript_22797:177-1061(-)